MKNILAILDTIDQRKLLGFIRALEPDNTNLWPSLFPYVGTDDMKVEYLRGAYNAPVIMTATGFESEASMGDRGSFSREELELIKFAKKLRLNENEIRKTLMPRQNTGDADAAVRQIYDDAASLFRDADVTREKMAMDAVSTGKINLRGLECDFQIPTDHQDTLLGNDRWSEIATAHPLEDEQEWISQLVDTDYCPRPTRALTSTAILNYLLKNPDYRNAYWGKPLGAVEAPALNREQFNQVRGYHDLPVIKTYDRQARTQAENGTFTSARLLSQEKFILLPPGKLGDMLHGVPTETVLNDPELSGSARQGIYTYNYGDHEPPALYTKAVMLAFPTFPAADQIFQATVL